MQLGIVILTWNRWGHLQNTLQQIHSLSDFDANQMTVAIVDSCSDTPCPPPLQQRYPDCLWLRLNKNLGSPGRNIAAEQLDCPYLLFLDDDSYPLPGCLAHGIAELQTDTNLAALGGQVQLPDAGQDGAAYPRVFPACGLFVRRSHFMAVGGFPEDFQRQAEEYALSFKLLKIGGKLKRVESLRFFHAKTPTARQSETVRRLDLKNNLLLCGRHLCSPWRQRFRHDWMQRYIRFAEHDRVDLGLAEILKQVRQQLAGDKPRAQWRLNEPQMDLFFDITHQQRRIADWAGQHQIQRACIATLAKNIAVTLHAAENADLQIIGILDDHPAWAGQTCAKRPVMPTAAIGQLQIDGIVLAEINPARVEQQWQKLNQLFDGPICRLWP